MPTTGQDFAYWKEIAVVIGFALLWFKNGREVGKVEQIVSQSAETIEEIKKKEYCTKQDCEECQERCQKHTWDRLLLALEKRDREFDRKFSHICQGIAEIKAEVKQR